MVSNTIKIDQQLVTYPTKKKKRQRYVLPFYGTDNHNGNYVTGYGHSNIEMFGGKL